MDSELYGTTLKNTFHYGDEVTSNHNARNQGGVHAKDNSITTNTIGDSTNPHHNLDTITGDMDRSLQSVDVEYNLVRNLIDAQQLNPNKNQAFQHANSGEGVMPEVEANVLIQELLQQFGVNKISDFEEMDSEEDNI